jgi:hypothetical protein
MPPFTALDQHSHWRTTLHPVKRRWDTHQSTTTHPLNKVYQSGALEETQINIFLLLFAVQERLYSVYR